MPVWQPFEIQSEFVIETSKPIHLAGLDIE